MSRSVEYLFADRKTCKLTVTPTRVTMKFPSSINLFSKVVIEKFFLDAAAKIDPAVETLSLRGELQRNLQGHAVIRLRNQNQNISFTHKDESVILEDDIYA